MLTRRMFVQGAGALAAAASIPGFLLGEGVREYGPVYLQTHFLSDKPIKIPVNIYVDGKGENFGMRSVQTGVSAEVPLLYLRPVVERHWENTGCFMTIRGEDTMEVRGVLITTHEGTVVFSIYERAEESVRVWLPVEDVRKLVLA